MLARSFARALSTVPARVSRRAFAAAAAAGAGKPQAITKQPVTEEQDRDGVKYFREINGAKVYCNKDGVPNMQSEPTIEWLLPNPPAAHLFEELPKMVFCNHDVGKAH